MHLTYLIRDPVRGGALPTEWCLKADLVVPFNPLRREGIRANPTSG